jgi:predicted phage gp36 major capsid-like protein
MKSNILLCAGLLLVSVQAYAGEKTAAEKFIAFNTMEKGHKADWFAHMRKMHDNKFALLDQINADWTDYRINNTRQLQAVTNFSADEKNKIFTDQLNGAAAVHEKHAAQFKKLYEDFHKEGLAIHDRHQQELDAFLGRTKTAKQEQMAKATKGASLVAVAEEVEEE